MGMQVVIGKNAKQTIKSSFGISRGKAGAGIRYYTNAKKFDLGLQKVILQDGIKYNQKMQDKVRNNREFDKYQKRLDKYRFVLAKINKVLKK